MPFPAATLTSLTATGDSVTGPGVPNVLIGGLPAAVMGDMVVGPVCNSGPALIVDGSPTVIVSGRPLARMTSKVVGLTIAVPSPVPVSTVIMKGVPTVLVP